ncbi:Trafficking protein particle complex subunit - like 2 [Theobroma cacao]|nr:Trafficking protein particle complex subunit - like 2 [Theobroma cacao]
MPWRRLIKFGLSLNMTEKTHSTCISPARSSFCHATKIILVTHPRTGDLCEPLKYIYNLYIKYVAKNPLYIPLELQSVKAVWHGQFLPLQQLQDESNPDFVVEVVFLFFDDSKKLLNDLTIA